MIWGFALPSGSSDICRGMTSTCQSHCYAIRYGQYRTNTQAKYQRNLELSKLSDFAQRMRYFILHHEVPVVRIHTGGDFYSVRYIRQWMRVMQWLPQVQFFAYTRSWRIPQLKRALDQMAELPNIRLWYSCDRDSGVPSDIPASVRLCWLMTESDDVPLQSMDLVFRVSRLRRIPLQQVDGMRVCPDENGHRYAQPPHCETCGSCWRAPAQPVIVPS